MKQILYYIFTLAIIGSIITSCQKEDDPQIIEPIIIEPPISPVNTLNNELNAKLNDVFTITEVPSITMEISTTEWNTFLANFDLNSQNEEYIVGNFTLTKAGITTKLDSVGFKLKGNTSRKRPEGEIGEAHNPNNPSWHHAHFALNFSKYIKSQKYKGLNKINLKWFKDDSNYVREVYCYDLFERFGVWTAPHSSYCKLTIKIKENTKPAYFGVYQMIESIDEDYLKNREVQFGSSNANLWKCSWGADLRNADPNRMGVEQVTLDPNTSKNYIYDLKTNKKTISAAKTQLSLFITELNAQSSTSLKSWITAHCDVDLLLKTYAVNVMVGMWDDYWINSNNYYFYLDASSKLTFIPYDYDNTLGTSAIINDSGTQNLLSWGNSSNNPLIAKILSIPEYKTMYINNLYDLANPINKLFNSSSSMSRISNWQSMITPYLSNDTGEDMAIYDRPASWSNQSNYRLNSMDNNYFAMRASILPPK